MAKANTSSVKTIKAEKIAALGNENKNSNKVAFSQEKNQVKQIVNSKKSANLQLAKKKANFCASLRVFWIFWRIYLCVKFGRKFIPNYPITRVLFTRKLEPAEGMK